MCTVLLPPGDNPIAVNKYIISYHIWYMSLCIDDRLVCRFGWDCSPIQTCTPNCHLYTV